MLPWYPPNSHLSPFFFFLWHEPLESLKYLILQMQSEHTKTFINVYEFQTSEDTR